MFSEIMFLIYFPYWGVVFNPPVNCNSACRNPYFFFIESGHAMYSKILKLVS